MFTGIKTKHRADFAVWGWTALSTGIAEDEASLFHCIVCDACDGVGEDQGEAEGEDAQFGAHMWPEKEKG